MSASDDRGTERVRLHEMMAISEAERAVADARMAELKAAQDLAWHRHNAAKGRITRARKDGSAAKIAAAVERERAAYAEFDRISGEVIEEMFEINSARMSALGELNDQMSRAWAEDAAAPNRIMGRNAEAGHGPGAWSWCRTTRAAS